MKNDSYWENRAAWDMYHRMENAEETADLLAKVYRNASMLLTYKAEDVFEKYMRIFDPATNQKLNAWQMDYRRFHDIWILDNKLDSIYLSIQEAKS